MPGLDLNKPVLYRGASFRFFEKKEHHITRFCRVNVLLLVFDGVLRFSEDGIEREVRAGEYYIQRKNCHQGGAVASDAPQYLYVHFGGEWTDAPDALADRGRFDPSLLLPLMERLDRAAHEETPYNLLQYLFLELLLSLRKPRRRDPLAERIARYIEEGYAEISSLADICKVFHYSKNYVLRVFHKEYGNSPIQYLNEVKLKRAMYLLETTSRPTGEIAAACGYADYPYFYKRFVEKTGLAPRKWRKRMQENA